MDLVPECFTGQLQYCDDRGLFNTEPLAHSAGASAWAVSEGFGVTDCQYLKGETVSLRMLPRTQTGVLDVDDAVVHSYSVVGTNMVRWSPGRVRVNGVKMVRSQV